MNPAHGLLARGKPFGYDRKNTDFSGPDLDPPLWSGPSTIEGLLIELEDALGQQFWAIRYGRVNVIVDPDSIEVIEGG